MKEIVVSIIDNSRTIYHLFANGYKLKKDDKVVIETDFGFFIARIIKENYVISDDLLFNDLKNVFRIATEEDMKNYRNNYNDCDSVLNYAKRISSDLGLCMCFVDAIFNLDKSVLLISYVSDNRIDFRELAKKLAQKYHTRIELRQIGVRDKAKKVGGIGPCGLFLCCNTFLSDFNSVSINMAKNQSLALTPSKINGVCGRLLCCLGYEDECYKELKSGFPKIGSMIKHTNGVGKVVSFDIFLKTITVDFGDNGIISIGKEDVYEGVK